MDRVKRFSMQVLEQHRDRFTTDFAENKKTLDQVAIVRSKGLKNEMAGYITKYVKREMDTKAAKDEEAQVDEVEAEVEDKIEEETTDDSAPREILVENQSQESS